jgi:hypothetical protein
MSMAQIYFLSVIYLFLSACLLLVDKYGATFLFLINLKTFYHSKKSYPTIFMVTGLVIAAGLIFFPMSPGPVVLGDFLPAINILIDVFYFFLHSKKEKADTFTVNNSKRNALGFTTLGVAVFHFLFSSIVLL